MFWISAIFLVAFMLGVSVYTFFVNRSWLPYVALFVVICLILGICTLYLDLSISYPVLLLANAVGVILLVGTLISLKFLTSKLPVLFILISMTFAFLSVVVALNFVAQKNHYLKVDRNAQQLQNYINRDSKVWPKYLAYFPKEVSPKYQNASFFSGRLYDLTVLQLRCKMSPSEVKNILDTYISKAKYIEDGYNSTAVNKKAYWLHKFRNDSNDGFAPLPPHFKVMVLYVDPEANEPAWQVYYNSGIAVSTKTNEVIYWANYPG